MRECLPSFNKSNKHNEGERRIVRDGRRGNDVHARIFIRETGEQELVSRQEEEEILVGIPSVDKKRATAELAFGTKGEEAEDPSH